MSAWGILVGTIQHPSHPQVRQQWAWIPSDCDVSTCAMPAYAL